jgi:two-component system, cell cycle sensor histidine kinase and response regulator CckA
VISFHRVSSNSFDPEKVIRALCDQLPVGVWVARAPGGEFVYANEEFTHIMGTGGLSEPVVGSYSEPYGIFGSDGKPYPENRLPFVRALVERKEVMVDDLVIHRPDGRRVPVRALARPMFDGDEITHVVIAFFDVTLEREALRQRAESEVRLGRAQRMEAVGKLAGGIAHDFNNLLTAIRAIATRLAALERDPERLVDLKTIDEVAERASSLTRQLTSFARRDRKLAEAVSLNAMIGAMSEVLRRALDAGVEVQLEAEAARDEVAGDLSQLEQVLMNLLFNARDAMPEGGRLTVRTRNVELGDDAPLSRGTHVVLEIADTGTGIDPAVRERMFEPYVTTKSSQRGGGLGLSTVYGIVEAHRGIIEALDGESRGTIMRVTLPLAPPGLARRPVAPRRTASEPTPLPVVRGGTVLLVEDEQLVRVSTFRALRQLGYTVIACADGDEAVEIFRDRRGDIHLVLLDVAMPRMSGRQTYLALRGIDPEVRVLLMAGGTHGDEVDRILSLGARAFLPKPFELATLSRALESVRGS